MNYYTSDEINQVITNAHCYISKLALQRIDDIITKGSSFLEERFFYLEDLMTSIEDRVPYDIAVDCFQQLVALLDSEVGDCTCKIDPTYILIYGTTIIPIILPISFLRLDDTPKTYVGQAGKLVAVSGDESGLVFIDPSGGGGVPSIIRIIDSLTPYSGGGGGGGEPDGNFLYIVNRGDSDISYTPVGGSPLNLSPSTIYSFEYYNGNPNLVPNLTFDSSLLYSIEPDGVVDADATFLNSVDALNFLNQFNEAFTLIYGSENSNTNLNIKSKNLIVSVDDLTLGATITQLQIKNVTTNTIKYDALSSLGSSLLYLGSDLDNSGNEIQVLVASTNANLQIAITAGNIDGVLYKIQNFLSSDSDNNLQAPIRVVITSS